MTYNPYASPYVTYLNVPVHIPIVQPTRCICYLKLFILVKRSTCFWRSFCPSSGAQNCVYSNGICQTAAATCCYRGWDGTPCSSISSPMFMSVHTSLHFNSVTIGCIYVLSDMHVTPLEATPNSKIRFPTFGDNHVLGKLLLGWQRH